MWKKALSAALLASGLAASPAAARAEAPAPYQITPELEAAAKAEGKVVFYTATDVAVAEKLAEHFKTKYPGIDSAG